MKPFDEALLKNLGRAIHEARLRVGLSIEETNAIAANQPDQYWQPMFPRALSLVTREIRDSKQMSRMELSAASGVELPLINLIERAKMYDLTITVGSRIALALGRSPADFISQVIERAKQLAGS